MAGRPTKLTPETHAAIVNAIGLGATYATAAGVAGVEYTTFRDWMTRGEKAGRGEFYNFYHAVKKAQAECNFKATNVVISVMANKDNPPEVRLKASLEYLKRRDRAEWGDNVRLDVGALSDAEIMRLLGVAQQAAPENDDSPTP